MAVCRICGNDVDEDAASCAVCGIKNPIAKPKDPGKPSVRRKLGMGCAVVTLLPFALLIILSVVDGLYETDAERAERAALEAAELARIESQRKRQEQAEQARVAEIARVAAMPPAERAAYRAEQAARKEALRVASLTPEEREAEERERKGFHCLSSWDGRHWDFTEAVKRTLNDPDSFEHDATYVTPVQDGRHTIKMEFRARNKFGGMVRATARGSYANYGCAHRLDGVS